MKFHGVFEQCPQCAYTGTKDNLSVSICIYICTYISNTFNFFLTKFEYIFYIKTHIDYKHKKKSSSCQSRIFFVIQLNSSSYLGKKCRLLKPVRWRNAFMTSISRSVLLIVRLENVRWSGKIRRFLSNLVLTMGPGLSLFCRSNRLNQQQRE